MEANGACYSGFESVSSEVVTDFVEYGASLLDRITSILVGRLGQVAWIPCFNSPESQ